MGEIITVFLSIWSMKNELNILINKENIAARLFYSLFIWLSKQKF
jgi:hypothetical protein